MPYIRYRTFSLFPGFKHSIDSCNCKPYCTIRIRKHQHKKLRGETLVMLKHGVQGAVHSMPLFCNVGLYSRKPYCYLMLGANTLKSLKNKNLTLEDTR